MQEQGVVEPVGGSGMPPPQDSGGMGKKFIVAVVISVLLSVGIVYGVITPNLVTKADDTKNIASLSARIDVVSSELGTVKGNVSGYATQASVSSLQTDLNSVKASAGDKSKIDALQVTLTAIQTDLNTLKASAGDKSKIDALQSSLDGLKTHIATLEARVKALETPTTTTTTTTTSKLASDTLNGVTAIIEPYSYSPINPFYGTTIETIPITTNSTRDGVTTFRLTIENKSAAGIKDLVLSLSFGVANNSGNLQTLTATNVNLSSQGMLPQWVNQLSGNYNYLLFYGGSFGVFNFSQAVGDRTYLCNLSIPAGANLAADTTYYLYPQIKVVSFNKQ